MKWFLGAMATFLTMGCEVTKSGEVNQLEPDAYSSDPAYRMTRAQIVADYADASCDPLYTNPEVPSDGDVKRGWVGEIHVPPVGFRSQLSQWESNLDRYMQPDAVLLSTPLYMQTLDVPTRMFTEGFPTMIGGTVKDDSGNELEEYFHLNLESGLLLGDEHEPGLYEFAALSDDGMRLSIDDVTYMQSTSVHPTRLVCGTTRVQLSRGELKNLHVSYFQGPRYHIALQLLWRKVNTSTAAEPLCGHTSNDDWFTYSVSPPVPKQKYLDLQSRGWSVVPASAFVLPGYEPLNPCLSERVKEVLADEVH